MSLRSLAILGSAGIGIAGALACTERTPDAPETAELTACPSTNVVDEPTQFQWTYHPVSADNPEPYYSGTLEYGEASFVINGETLTTRAYRQAGGEYSIPGPTMTMVPGNKYVVRYHNLLPYEEPAPDHNVMKDPNISNLHTHGLHISGETPSDDVTRFFEGGRGGDFVYDISADHMGGTFWYHAHHHGSTFLQVSSGAFGLIVIDDSNDGVPAPVASMVERQLLVAYLDPSVRGTGGDTLITGSLSPSWTVNGQINGNVCAPANEWQHWRMLLADADARPKTLGIGANCEVKLMARDGVWRTVAPKDLPTGQISLTAASRADFAVRCTDDSTITVNGSTVANILVDGAGDTGPHPYDEDGVSTWSADRPAYLRDLSGESNVNTETVRMGARTINGSKFDHMNPTFSLPADQVQEWDIRGAGQHPFHLHVYHFQAGGGCGGDFEQGEYYDTLAGSCAVRFDLSEATSSPFFGRTIMHCHVLEHEDQGAMGWLQVESGQGPPSFPADTSVTPAYANYYTIGGPGPMCGDGTCDPGESTCTCAADCGAPPSSEGVCTGGIDEDCDGAVDCDDADCDGDAACTTGPVCGDGTCDAGESSCSCAADCGAPPSTEGVCTGGVDDDCDGAVDCDDADCAGDAACTGGPVCGDGTCDSGEDCLSCANDCEGVTNGRPANRYCCGDGTLDGPEGDGSICDGNY